MDNLNLGQLITAPQQRDAIHIAVVPMIAGEDLEPGVHLALVGGTTDTVVEASPHYAIKAIGIADPFIHGDSWPAIPKGARFWMYLYPNTITGLRHDWTHPAFENAQRIVATAGEAELWLRAFASRWAFDYAELIETAANCNTPSEWGHYIVAQGRDLHSADELGEDHAMFWHNLERLTGKTFDADHRKQMGWSCTC